MERTWKPNSCCVSSKLQCSFTVEIIPWWGNFALRQPVESALPPIFPSQNNVSVRGFQPANLQIFLQICKKPKILPFANLHRTSKFAGTMQISSGTFSTYDDQICTLDFSLARHCHDCKFACSARTSRDFAIIIFVWAGSFCNLHANPCFARTRYWRK